MAVLFVCLGKDLAAVCLPVGPVVSPSVEQMRKQLKSEVSQVFTKGWSTLYVSPGATQTRRALLGVTSGLSPVQGCASSL